MSEGRPEPGWDAAAELVRKFAEPKLAEIRDFLAQLNLEEFRRRHDEFVETSSRVTVGLHREAQAQREKAAALERQAGELRGRVEALERKLAEAEESRPAAALFVSGGAAFLAVVAAALAAAAFFQ